MKVKDFIQQEIDIDVYDDVCEALGIAFCGPLSLTDAGREKFAEVMEYDIEQSDCCAVVSVDDPDDRTWKHRLAKACEFFEAAAGYCAADDYDTWFFTEEV